MRPRASPTSCGRGPDRQHGPPNPAAAAPRSAHTLLPAYAAGGGCEWRKAQQTKWGNSAGHRHTGVSPAGIATSRADLGFGCQVFQPRPYRQLPGCLDGGVALSIRLPPRCRLSPVPRLIGASSTAHRPGRCVHLPRQYICPRKFFHYRLRIHVPRRPGELVDEVIAKVDPDQSSGVQLGRQVTSQASTPSVNESTCAATALPCS